MKYRNTANLEDYSETDLLAMLEKEAVRLFEDGKMDEDTFESWFDLNDELLEDEPDE